MNQVLRTAKDGCWQLSSNGWGQFLVPAADPLADTVITREQLQGFELNEGITPIPAELWSAWIDLCFALNAEDNRNLEVSCRLLRKEDDKSQWRIVVPRQVVTGASVRVNSFDDCVDIVSGELISQWPPAGWQPCGSSHSHNTMDAFFSGTDDRYELGDPGLHIVVGRINNKSGQYTLKASVTAHRRRFTVEPKAVVDLTPDEAKFHPAAREVIKLPAPRLSYPYGWTTKSQQMPPAWDVDYELDLFHKQPKAGSQRTSVLKSTDALHDALPDAVAEAVAAATSAIEQIKVECENAGFASDGVLEELAWQINDLAADAAHDLSTNDPFYYSSY